MNKHERYYQKVEDFKQRFRKLPSETIRNRLNSGSLFKEAAIAYREILEERGEPIYSYKNNPVSEPSNEKDLA